MTKPLDLVAFTAAAQMVEPAARVVPGRAIRRAIRLTRPSDDRTVVHDQVWWVDRDRLFENLTPAELGLTRNQPERLLLIAEPVGPVEPQTWLELWRTLFHAQVDRAFEKAIE